MPRPEDPHSLRTQSPHLHHHLTGLLHHLQQSGVTNSLQWDPSRECIKTVGQLKIITFLKTKVINQWAITITNFTVNGYWNLENKLKKCNQSFTYTHTHTEKNYKLHQNNGSNKLSVQTQFGSKTYDNLQDDPGITYKGDVRTLTVPEMKFNNNRSGYTCLYRKGNLKLNEGTK